MAPAVIKSSYDVDKKEAKSTFQYKFNDKLKARARLAEGPDRAPMRTARRSIAVAEARRRILLHWAPASQHTRPALLAD